jgi:hypothetical protein
MKSFSNDIFELIVANGKSSLMPAEKFPTPGRMSIMPCSHLIDSMRLEYTGYTHGGWKSKGFSFHGYAPMGNAHMILNDELYRLQTGLWEKREPERAHDYIHDSLRFALSSNAAIENDRFLKVDKWVNSYSGALAKIMNHPYYPVVQEAGYDLARFWVESFVNGMFYGDHTYGYVKAHETAHPAKGATWGQILLWEKMGYLWEFTSEVGESWKVNFDEEGNWSLDQRTINFGNRSRSPDIYMFIPYFQWLLERNRQIGYVTGISSLNAFVTHELKMKVMRTIFDNFKDLVGCPIYCPKTEGGSIYTMLRDSYLSGKTLVHYDVGGMELITPSLIQGKLGQFNYGIGVTIGYLNMIPELLSGVSCTSDWDMIAHLILLSVLLYGRKKPLYIVILGDDCTLVYDSESDVDIMVTPLYERQLKDDKLVRTLGLVTGEWMHPSGCNFTIDRADKRIQLRDNWGAWINNSMPMPNRKLIAEFFAGSINTKPVHEILKNAPPYDYVYSPKELVLIQVGLLDISDKSAIITKSNPIEVRSVG